MGGLLAAFSASSASPADGGGGATTPRLLLRQGFHAVPSMAHLHLHIISDE